MNINTEDEACLHALQYTNSWMITMVLNAAIELDIFGIIARAGPEAQHSASEIASQMPANDPAFASRLDRMLCLFVTHSFLTCSLRNNQERFYGLSPASKFLLPNEDEGSLVSVLALASHQTTVEVWLRMKEAIIESGNQFNKVHGMSIFQHMDRMQDSTTYSIKEWLASPQSQ